MPSVAIIGTRGYPSYYGGLETAVRNVAPHLADSGWDVTVYGRRGTTKPRDQDADARITARETRGLETKSLSTLSYGLTASLDAVIRKPDVALVMNVANGYFLPLLRARGIPTLFNVDGIEWERAKWSPLGKRVFRTGANLTARWANTLLFDARAIERYWQETYGSRGIYIPYGGDIPPTLPVPSGLQHRGYVLMVARFVPENTVWEFFQAIPGIAARYPVVIVGSSGYGGEFDDAAQKLTDNNPNVSWLGHVSDDSLLFALWQHSGVYFHGHTVGGTNPALVQAMAAGAPTLARDTIYSREVLGPTGRFVGADPASITTAVLGFMDNRTELDQAARANQGRAAKHYSWAQICQSYEHALRSLLPA